MPTPIWESAGRTPHPLIRRGSYLVPGVELPKFWSAHGPHSPLRAGFIRSQSGTKLRFASLHERVVEVTLVATGLLAIKIPPTCNGSRYWPALTRSEVLP